MQRLLASLFVFGLLLTGCGPTSAPEAADSAATDAVPAAYAYPFDPNAPLPSESLYAFDAAWTTDAGTPLQLADLRGRPVVIAMVYAHCAYACPLIVRDMKELATGLPDGNDIRYVLVSLDPERDTVEQLQSFRNGFDLGEAWTLLRGDARDVRRLAALLGVRYRAEADGQISHSNLITVLDRDGRIAAQQEGLGAEAADAPNALRSLIAAR